MRNQLNDLIWGNEVAEDATDDELMKYFITQDSFSEFLNTDKKLLLLLSARGVGKSALLRWIGIRSKNNNSLVIYAKLSSNTFQEYFNKHPGVQPSPASWVQALACAINRQLGAEVSSRLAGSEESLLQELSENCGKRKMSWLGGMARRIDWKGLRLVTPEVADELSLLKRVLKKKVWLLIDDIDSKYKGSNEEKHSLSCLITACRDLVNELDGKCLIRIAARSDVWPSLRQYDPDLDKAKQYIRTIQWSKEEFGLLILKRIAPYLNKNFSQLTGALSDLQYIFPGPYTIRGIERTPETMLFIYATGRPRWGIHLCEMGRKLAIERNLCNITTKCIDDVLPVFGQTRIEDLATENRHRCPSLSQVLQFFKGCPPSIDRRFLLNRLRLFLQNEQNCDLGEHRTELKLANFLFQIGFIKAVSMNTGYAQLYHYDEQPNYLTSESAQDDGVKWEIHPLYHVGNDIIRRDKALISGRRLRSQADT